MSRGFHLVGAVIQRLHVSAGGATADMHKTVLAPLATASVLAWSDEVLIQRPNHAVDSRIVPAVALPQFHRK